MPLLVYFNHANNPVSSAIPAGWWEGMPVLQRLDLSACGLTGPIPAPASLRSFKQLALSDNQLSGSLPANLTALTYNVARNQLSGPVWLPPYHPAAEDAHIFVDLSHNQLSCPIRLAHLTTLRRLVLQNGGFDGCDFNDPTLVQLPSSVTTLDVSDSCAQARRLIIAVLASLLRPSFARCTCYFGVSLSVCAPCV